MAGKLKDDEIRFILSLDAKGLQSEIVNVSSKSQDLTNTNKKLGAELKVVEKDMDSLQKQMAKLSASGDTSSEKYERLRKAFIQVADDANDLRSQISANEKAIENYNRKAEEIIRTMKVEDMTMDQLSQRAKELESQLRKTSESTDPAAYAELEKRLTEVRGRMGELNKGSSETQNIFAEFTSGVNKYWAAIVAGYKTVEGVFSTWKDLMLSNKATGVEFKATMDGVNEALEYAKVAFATMDFTNFIDGMVNAYEVGKEISKMLDELFERQNSFNLTTAPVRAELEEMKTQLRDVNLSNVERINIGTKIKAMTEDMAKLQKDIIKQEIDANSKRLDAHLAMSEAEKEYVIFNYNANIDSIRYAKEVIELEKERDSIRRTGLLFADKNEKAQFLERETELNTQIDLLKKTAEFSETAYNAMQKYLLSSNEMIKGYVDAQMKSMNVDIQTKKELRRTETMMNRLKKSEAKGDKSGETAEKKALAKQKKELNELLEKLETTHRERLAKIKKEYLDGDIKTESEFNRKIYAQEQANFLLREESLNTFLKSTTKEEVRIDVNKKIAEIQDKRLTQEIEFRKRLEKIILNANPLEKEKQAYAERLRELDMFGETSESLRLQMAAASTEEEKQALQKKYEAFILLEKEYQDNVFKINEQEKNRKKALAEEQFEQEFKARKDEMQLELNNLMVEAAASGKNGFDAEMAVHIQRLQMLQEEIAARRNAGLETTKQVERIGKVEAQMTATLQKENSKRAAQYNQYANSMGTAMGEVLSGQKSALEAFGGSMIDILFDILGQIINTKIVEATAVAVAEQAKAAAIAAALPDSVVTFGASAALRTAAIGAIIMGALQAAKVGLKGLLSKKKSDSSSSSSGSSSSGRITVKNQGFADGGFKPEGYTGDGQKYDVKGYFPDGQPYHAGEYIIPKEVLKNPAIIPMVRQIEAVRTQKTNVNPLPKGFADGGFHNFHNNLSGNNQMTADPVQSEMLELLRYLKANGIDARTYFGDTEYQARLQRVNETNKRFSRQ